MRTAEQVRQWMKWAREHDAAEESVLDMMDSLLAGVERQNSLLYGGRCVYCGEVVGADTQNQVLSDDALRRHVENCSSHPYVQMKAERDRYKAALERIAAVEGIAGTVLNLREQVPWLQNRGYAGMVLILSRAAAQLEMVAEAVRG